jgi:hypothetical protein
VRCTFFFSTHLSAIFQQKFVTPPLPQQKHLPRLRPHIARQINPLDKIDVDARGGKYPIDAAIPGTLLIVGGEDLRSPAIKDGKYAD